MRKELSFSEFSDKLFEYIDITPTQYKTAISHYQAVAQHLASQNCGDDIYVQGSFALGTVIRPFKGGVDADFDMDIVCQGSENKSERTPQFLKMRVKDGLLSSPHHAKLLSDKEGRRCWTLKYAHDDSGTGFHMDILPCVAECDDIVENIKQKCKQPEYADFSIAITDKEKSSGKYSWSTGNARGYAQWFDIVNEPYLAIVSHKQIRTLVENRFFASIAEVPKPLLRSSLQRVIQILKRHRDCRFDNKSNEDDKPISIIITTLVAQIAHRLGLYSAPVQDLLIAAVNELSRFAVLQNDNYELHAQLLPTDYLTRTMEKGWKILNPVNQLENFAERWSENNHAKAKAFFQWLSWAKEDFDFDGKESGIMFNQLKVNFGEETVTKIYRALELNPLPTAMPLVFATKTKAPKPYAKDHG